MRKLDVRCCICRREWAVKSAVGHDRVERVQDDADTLCSCGGEGLLVKTWTEEGAQKWAEEITEEERGGLT